MSLKKALKIGCLYPFLALIGISILIVIAEVFKEFTHQTQDVEILPEETHDTVETSTPPQEISTPSEEDPASMTSDEVSQDGVGNDEFADMLKKMVYSRTYGWRFLEFNIDRMPKMMVWDQTPEAQGVAVGDWIHIRGHPVGFIGAYVKDEGTHWVLKRRGPFFPRGDHNYFWLVSNPSGLSVMDSLPELPTCDDADAEDRIVIHGSVVISPQSKHIDRINFSYFNQGESPLIWVVAEIKGIYPPDPSDDCFPGQWHIKLTDVRARLVSE